MSTHPIMVIQRSQLWSWMIQYLPISLHSWPSYDRVDWVTVIIIVHTSHMCPSSRQWGMSVTHFTKISWAHKPVFLLWQNNDLISIRFSQCYNTSAVICKIMSGLNHHMTHKGSIEFWLNWDYELIKCLRNGSLVLTCNNLETPPAGPHVNQCWLNHCNKPRCG